MKLQAVVFDFDGIIVDSEPLHHRAFCRVLEPLNLPLSWGRYYEHYLGFDDRDVLRHRFKEEGIHLDEPTMRKLMAEKARVLVEIIRSEGVKAYPGVVELVHALSGQLPVALCSGALASDIDPVLDILKLEKCFSARITADQVHVSKPDPESYRCVFAALCGKFPERVTDASRCLAIEDTPAGIDAARGAGLRVLAVRNTYEPEALVRADRVVDTLAGLDIAALDGIIAGV